MAQPKIAFSLPKRSESFVVGESNQNKEITSSKPNELIYLSHCNQGSYKCLGKLAKFIVEGCSDCKINLDCLILTGTVEVINSKNIVLEMKSIVPTIVVEKTQGCQLNVPTGWGKSKGQGSLFTSSCQDISVVSDGKTYQVQTPDETTILVPEKTNIVVQYISRFFKNELNTEVVIREGGGYATTVAEKELADKKLEADLKILKEVMAAAAQKRIPQQKPQTKKPTSKKPKDKSPSKEGLPNPGSLTGHTTKEEIEEHFDDPKEVEWKVKLLAENIKESKHLVVYTGAGISTSAKIPDYRGPKGVWTLRDKGETPKFEVTMEQALPTTAHMSLLELEKQGIMKFLVSTNVDGLHRRSGISVDKIAELHGNCYLEKCSTCGKEYLRTFDVGCTTHHKTGRTCDKNGCNGALIDSIINFGENLPLKELESTQNHASQSDFALVLGTSMRVQPACSFPSQAVKNGGKMVIVNLQKTPFDGECFLIIRERTDKVMELLMKELKLEVPQYHLEEDAVTGLGNLHL